jgi:predicted O-methyltransferase YrrM
MITFSKLMSSFDTLKSIIYSSKFDSALYGSLPKLKHYSATKLLYWLKNEAGLQETEGNHVNWFGVGNKIGGLEIQQVPEEYVELLMLLKKTEAESYLCIGIGKGGSFVIETIMQGNLNKSVAVDNSSYWQDDQRNSIKRNISYIKANSQGSVEFHDMDSVQYLKACKDRFDVIFIDGDHSYEGVKADFEHAKPRLNSDGFLIFHDIASRGCPGVVQLWDEIKNDRCEEFVHSDTCGIGIWRAKT